MIYHLLKGIKDDNILEQERSKTTIPSKVQIYTESDDYQCKHGECDI